MALTFWIGSEGMDRLVLRINLRTNNHDGEKFLAKNISPESKVVESEKIIRVGAADSESVFHNFLCSFLRICNQMELKQKQI